MNLVKPRSTKLLDQAKLYLSEETELIHLSYESRPFQRGDSAPMYHNFLFALILLQTKERAHMEHAMTLIERLLHFQIQSGDGQGNFPRYLHEFPRSTRRFEIVDILLVLNHIVDNFYSILPKPLKAKLSTTIETGLEYLKSLLGDSTFSYGLNFQIGCLFDAYGRWLNNKQLSEQGSQMLKELFARGVDQSWGSHRSLSKIVLFMQLLDFETWQDHLAPLYHFMSNLWNETLNTSIGPALNEHFYKDDFEYLFFHAFMGVGDCLLDADAFELSLLNPKMPKPQANDFIDRYTVGPFAVEQYVNQGMCASLFQLPIEEWEKRGGFYPFKLLLQNNKEIDHFVLQMGTYVEIEALNDHTYRLVFFPTDDELDISFFANLSSNVSITSKQKQASLFDLSAPIEFQFSNQRVVLSFVDYDVERNLWAHLCQDNRKSQMDKGFNHTHDWHLYFRKTRPEDKSPFVVQIEIFDSEMIEK